MTGQAIAGHGDGEATLLVVGAGEPMVDALSGALASRSIIVERATTATCAETAVAVAPDVIMLVGDATVDGGTAALRRLQGTPLASVTPVVLLADGPQLEGRIAAFRFGATAVVPRSASVDAIATRLAELVKEIPERSTRSVGQMGESTLDQFVSMLA